MIDSESPSQSIMEYADVKDLSKGQNQDIRHIYKGLNIKDELTEHYIANLQNMEAFDRIWNNQ